MIPVFLTTIKTRDGITLDGILIEPRKKSDTALIWIHGLGSNFSHGQTLVKELSTRCVKNRIAYFKFNTRGHDVVNRDAPKEKGLRGAAFEKFEECILDIRAMIAHARAHGYKKIILAGHSTGANKILYYVSKTEDRRVKGLVLLGPISDIAAAKKEHGAAWIVRGLRVAEKLKSKKDALMPPQYGIITVARFLSLHLAGKNEDAFPYHRPDARWPALEKIRQPVAVIIGERDEYLDRPAQKLIEIFRAHAPLAKSFSGVIIKSVDHGFKSKEKEFSKIIINWIKQAMG